MYSLNVVSFSLLIWLLIFLCLQHLSVSARAGFRWSTRVFLGGLGLKSYRPDILSFLPMWMVATGRTILSYKVGLLR